MDFHRIAIAERLLNVSDVGPGLLPSWTHLYNTVPETVAVVFSLAITKHVDDKAMGTHVWLLRST